MRLLMIKPLAALAAFLSAIVAAPAALADAEAEAFVQAILKEAEPSLNASDQDVLFDGIALLIDKYVDMRRVGLFTLGQYARKMSAEQKDAYFPLFEQYATIIYQNTLSDYSGQTLEVTGSVDRSERDVIVKSRIVDAQPGDPLADTIIHWRVYRSREGKMSIVDAGADNVWLAIEQRSQFTSIIANNGGAPAGIDALIAELREKVGA